MANAVHYEWVTGCVAHCHNPTLCKIEKQCKEFCFEIMAIGGSSVQDVLSLVDGLKFSRN